MPLELLRVLEERDDLFDLVLGLVRARHVRERDLVLRSLSIRALLLPKLMALPPPAWSCRMKRKNMTPMKIIGTSVTIVVDQNGELSSFSK